MCCELFKKKIKSKKIPIILLWIKKRKGNNKKCFPRKIAQVEESMKRLKKWEDKQQITLKD